MTASRRIGLFGGSFDPIHFGHLNIALQLKELAKLDEVLFCPAALSPFKTDQQPEAHGAHRLRMCELAVQEIEGCSVLDLEIKRGGVSYAIDTVQQLGEKVHLMLAEDALPRLHLWHKAEELLKIAPPLIGSRHSNLGFYLAEHFSPSVQKLIEKGRFKTRVMEISSTEIRKRVAEGGHYLGHWVPRKVLDYINANKLYSEGKYEERSTRDAQSSCSNHF